MNRPVFIVDGQTEQGIIQALCPKGTKVIRADINGSNVKIDAMVKKIVSLINLLGQKYHPIIILIDKEDRDSR